MVHQKALLTMARHAVRGRHADRQPRGHHVPRAAGPARGAAHRRRGHAPHGHLLRHFAITTPTVSLHEHNEACARRRSSAAAWRRASRSRWSPTPARRPSPIREPSWSRPRAAAGIPGRADSWGERGDRRRCRRPAGSTARLRFLGFPPTRSKDRKQWLADLDQAARTTAGCVLRGPAPNQANARRIWMILLNDRIIVFRELTKLHESRYRRALPAELIAADRPSRRASSPW